MDKLLQSAKNFREVNDRNGGGEWPPARPPPTIKLDSFTSILLVDRREKR